MKISRRHWLIRLAYYGTFGAPARTTLCRLFWLIVFKVLLVALVAGYVSLMGFLMYQNPFEFAIVIGGMSCVALIVVGVGFVKERYFTEPIQGADEPTVMSEAFYAVKNRVCPLIEIEHDK